MSSKRCIPLTTVSIVVFMGVHALAADVTILCTADSEGHVWPCQSCPMHAGNGGLARRASTVAKARAAGPVLLLDAGNFLFGADSLDSSGNVIVAAYDALGYDAVNISYRDFRFTKMRTLELLASGKTAAVSANVVDEASGKLLFSPYVVKQIGDRHIAVIGVTELPLGIDRLPHVKQQLAGIRVRSPVEALDEWLPKAQAESDQVVLLYYGTSAGLKQITSKHGAALTMIGVGNIRAEQLPANAKPPLVGMEEHGKQLGRAALAPDRITVDQLTLDDSIPADPAMKALVAKYAPAAPAMATTAPAATTRPIVSATAPATRPAIAATAPANSSAKAKGLAGVGLTADQVNASIDRGRAFLWQFLQADHAKHQFPGLVMEQYDLLAALALVHADAHEKIPEFDAQLRQYLSQFDPRSKQMPTYEAGIFCMLIEAYGDPVFLPKLRDTARYLVELQGSGGTWWYGHPLPTTIYQTQSADTALHVFGGDAPDAPAAHIDRLERITDWSSGKEGDNSTSQFALLGLRAAADWRIRPSDELWKRSLAVHRARQCQDGGWGYDEKDSYGYGSMTAAGISAVAINRHELGEPNPTDDPSITRGLAWLTEHFSVSENPTHGQAYLYYYLYSLERTGRILNTEFIGPHEWYPGGARFLVDAQKPDGHWVESYDTEDPRPTTSFALLFLTRATPALKREVAKNGSGELRTSVATAPPNKLYFILDASGSMLEQMDQKLKFDVAREAVKGMAALLPPKAQMAMRVYGHRKRSNEEGSDQDTELLIPWGDMESQRVESTLRSLKARGKTPLALSLEQSASDLQLQLGQPLTVVLLTDGGEDTRPPRDPVLAASDLRKIKNLTFHIVGFDINQDDWNKQLREMAAAAGGDYWPAPRGDDLNRALRAALLGEPEWYAILNANGTEIHRGRFGEKQRLPEGKYTLVTEFGGKEFRQPLWINTGAITAVTFDEAKVTQDATAKPAAGSPKAPVAPPAVAAKRFCTHCGAALRDGARFCTACGAKLE